MTMALAEEKFEIQNEVTMYLDSLKVCKMHQWDWNFKMPNTGEVFHGKNIIEGKDSDKCKVKVVWPNGVISNCKLRPKTVELITSKEEYDKARSNIPLGQDNEKIGNALASECKVDESTVPEEFKNLKVPENFQLPNSKFQGP